MRLSPERAARTAARPALLLCLLLAIGMIWAAAAQAAPNAPTLNLVEGQTAVPSLTLNLNITTGITLAGNAEASKTIQVRDGVTVVGTTTSNGAGAWSVDIALAAGSHNLTVVASDGSGTSSPSPSQTVLIDTTLPGINIRMLSQRGDDFTGLNYFHTDPAGEWYSNLYGGTLQAILSDSGGSGYNLASATMVLQQVDNAGTVLATVPGGATQTSANTIKFLLSGYADGNYGATLLNGNRYRLVVTLKDYANNTASNSYVFAIDNLKPQDRAEGTAIRKFYLFNADDGTISNPPPLSKLVPMVWNSGNGRYQVDPSFTNPALVDTSISPYRVRFNRLGFYGSLYAGDNYNPAPVTGYNSQSFQIINSSIFGWDSSANIGNLSTADANGNLNTYFFAMPNPLPNGGYNNSIFPLDSAYNYEYRTYYVDINSADPMPSHPSVSAFRDVSNSAITYWDRGHVYGSWDWPMLRTGNGNDIYVEGSVSSLSVAQVAEIVDGSDNTTVYGRVLVPAGTTSYQVRIGASPSEVGGWSPAVTALPNKTNRYFFTRSRTATKATSGVCWSCSGGWVIYKYDDLLPRMVLSEPASGGYYHGLSNALGAPNVPTSYRAEVEDIAPSGSHGIVQAPIDGSYSRLDLVNNAGTALANSSDGSWAVVDSVWRYTRTFSLSSMPTTEGTYRLRATLRDVAEQPANASTSTNLLNNSASPVAYYVDNTPPAATNIVPGGGTVASIPSFNADIVDPTLSNSNAGTPGSGVSLDLSQNQIDAYRRLGAAIASSSTSLTVPIDQPLSGKATDHTGQVLTSSLPAGAAVQVWRVSDNAIIGVGAVGNSLSSNATISDNGVGTANALTVTMTGGNTLTPGLQYHIYYLLPHFDSNNGSQKVAAVPTSSATYPGYYASRITARDRVGNTGTTVATTNIQMNDPPSGTITLTPAETILYILGTYPANATYVTSSVIAGGVTGVPVPDGTLVTVSVASTLEIVQPDANGVAADGHQIATGANGATGGKIRFEVRPKDTVTTGSASISASIGSATGSTSVSLQRPLLSLTKSADKTSAKPGEIITYTIAYANSGNSAALNVVLSDILPADVTFVAGSARLNGTPLADAAVYTATPTPRLSTTIASLAASGSGNFSFQVRVK